MNIKLWLIVFLTAFEDEHTDASFLCPRCGITN